MKDLLTTIRVRSRLFKQPHSIGDTFEKDGNFFLIVGIEKYRLVNDILTVWYTCQNLQETNYKTHKKTFKKNPMEVEAELKFKFDSKHLKTCFLGTRHFIDGHHYKVIEYTDIKIVSTDVHVSLLLKPLYPVDPQQAKSIAFKERRKKLQIELV
ncbi:hypothetical protein [Priestia megaterium]|uniref:hypothetical protein n=1 Tax=Priestia megaterium TaxID=1404 RepID=UPI002E228BAC|nr:hypothetical protein [Priestia megaterium]MED4102174.1 hypothetical protein [Priestia megaterium]MED4142601.1 hypothetical protein [Priestia megaterium]